MISRIDTLKAAMQAAEESAFLVTDGKNCRYLSGFTGSSGWLVVQAERVVLITDGRYWDQAERQCPEVELFRYLPTEHENLTGALMAVLGQGLGKDSVVAIELDDMPVALYRTIMGALAENGWRARDVEGRVKAYRSCKDAAELDLLRTAAAIADGALATALGRFELGMTEAALKAEIDYQVLLRGGEGAAFPTIVASGVNGSFPHAGASDKPIVAGELITIDFGAIWKGYCSDMTRTLWFGELSEHDRHLVEQVAVAQAAAVRTAKPGMTTGALDEVARSSLRQAGLADFFVHSLGHGVGLDVHESPTLRSGHTDLLRAGQVITIEPGVYLPGRTGCRIEDTVVLTDTECEVLNHHPKQRPTDLAPPLQ